MRIAPTEHAVAPSAELTVITAIQAIVPAEFFKPNGSDEVLAKLREEVRKQAAALDISTEQNRAALASLAYKVARSKTALDEQGKNLTEDLRKKKGEVDAERRRVWDAMEDLQNEVRKPLTDWENAEKQRVFQHEGALAAIAESADFGMRETSAELRNRLEFLTHFPSRDWQEFKTRAEKAISDEILRTEGLLARAEKREAAIAEAKRLDEESRERAIKEREEAAAKAAAERERVLAEQRAQEAQRAADAERQRIEREKYEAEARAKRAEAERIAAEAQAERLLEEAEKRRIAEEQAAKRRAEEAAAQAERDIQAAIEAERKRDADARRREAEEAEKRAKNRAHQASVNREILAALVKLGIPEDIGKDVVAAMAKGAIPHVTVGY